MKKISSVTLLLFLFAFTTQAQDTLAPSHQETIDFIEESINELKLLDPAGDVPTSLKENYNWFQTDMATCEKQEYFEGFLQNITQEYEQYGKYAKVNFTTLNDGAIIKLLTLLENTNKIPPRQADNPTNKCEMRLAPGKYFVWSERNEKPSSERRLIIIKLHSSLVTITEK